MAEPSPPGLGDLLALVVGTNPLAPITRTVGQFQKGVDDFLHAVENFNATMEQMNQVAARVNRLLDDVEPPVRALMPQLTRSIQAMDAIAEQLSGPVERVAPGLARLAEVLQSPQLTALPRDLTQVMDVVGDLSRRLQPLGQLAESAGGLFGLRPARGTTVAPDAGSAAPDPSPPRSSTPARKPRPTPKPRS